MNGIDRISERILEDARAEAARIVEEAQERAQLFKRLKHRNRLIRIPESSIGRGWIGPRRESEGWWPLLSLR